MTRGANHHGFNFALVFLVGDYVETEVKKFEGISFSS